MHFDALKRPVALGDTVLTKGYGSCDMDEIAVVTKITPKSVFVAVANYSWIKVPTTTNSLGHKWERDTSAPTKQMKRSSDSFVVISEQLAHNHSTYPELYI